MLRKRNFYEVSKPVPEYNPFDHRDYTHAVSNCGIVMHMLKSAVGAGMLSMPYAFWGAGWLLGIVMTTFLGGVITIALCSLVQVSREQCVRHRVPMLDYGHTAQMTLLGGADWLVRYAGASLVLVNTLLLFLYLGLCAVYVMGISTQLKQLYECQSREMEQSTNIPVEVYIAVTAVLYMGLLQFRDLRSIAPLSGLANLNYVVVIAIVFYYVFRTELPSMADMPLAGPVERYPGAAGIIVLSIENVGSVLPLENNMLTPQSYLGRRGVLPMTMAGIVVLYMCMGLFPYWRYGEHTQTVISLNFDQHDPLAMTAKALVVTIILVSYTLVGYTATDLLLRMVSDYVDKHHESSFTRTFLKSLIRAGLALVTVLLAIVIPNLGAIMTLTAALFLSSLGICIPVLLELVTFWSDGLVRRLKCLVIIAVYVVIVVFGVYDAIQQLVNGTSGERCPREPPALNVTVPTRRMMFTILGL